MNFNEKYPNTELRALSWKQPFASLMLHGKIETRVWDTKYRGWVLICASKSPYNYDQTRHISGYEQYLRIYETLKLGGAKGLWPTFGKAIAIGRLVNSWPMKYQHSDLCFVEYHEPWLHTSAKTGKKICKRLWCHVYEDVQPIEPMTWHGSQGWTGCSDYLKQQINII